MLKIVTLVCPSLSRNAPRYLADGWLVADARVRQLRSADTRTLVVSRRRSSFGDKTFAAAGSQNKSGTVSRPISDYVGCHNGQFRRLLKTFLFGQSGHGVV